MIIPGNTKELASSVLLSADNSPKYYGTVYAFVWLEDADDGYSGIFWNGIAWESGPNTFPTATHIKGSIWSYELPADATTLYSGSTIHWTMADSVSEADITTVCSHYSDFVGDLTTSSIADSVWDELQADHTTATTFGAMEANIRGTDEDDLKLITDKIELLPGLDEMAFVNWNIGENITVRLFVGDPSTGNGLTGQLSYINLNIHRASDTKYWNGTTWQVGAYDLDMTELDSTNQPGVYTYILSGSTGNTRKDTYIAYATVNNPGVIDNQQNFEVHVSKDNTIRVYESEPS